MTCSLAQARFTRSRTVSGAGSLTIPPREPLSPSERAALAGHPEGPLAITHRTGKRRNSSGTGRRFDPIRLTGHWTVQHISHLHDGIAAGSDHALVITDLATA